MIRYLSQWETETKTSRENEVIVVHPPDGDSIRVPKRDYYWRQRRLLASLGDRLGSFSIVSDKDAVPGYVVGEGTPAVAAYLYAVQEQSIDDIAEMLGVSSNTVNHYLSAVCNDRR